jgi:hypothetical protein
VTEVWSRGQHHRATVSLDTLAQAPPIQHHVEADASVHNGTRITLHWPEIARCLGSGEDADLYRRLAHGLLVLCADFGTCNPHADFAFEADDDRSWSAPASRLDWRKWRPRDATSPWWYSDEQFRDLVAAYLVDDREHARPERPMRDWLTIFDELSRTDTRKRVLARVGLERARLSDLLTDGQVDAKRTAALLVAVRSYVRPIKPQALGVMGQEHLTDYLLRWGVAAHTVKYRKVLGSHNGLPYCWEVALRFRRRACSRRARRHQLERLRARAVRHPGGPARGAAPG